MLVVVQLFVYDKAWTPFVVQGMVAVVVGGFEGFVKIIACFVIPLVTIQN